MKPREDAGTTQVLRRMADPMTKPTLSRAERATNLERWASTVSAEDLVTIDTTELHRVAEVVGRRDTLDDELSEADAEERNAGPW